MLTNNDNNEWQKFISAAIIVNSCQINSLKDYETTGLQLEVIETRPNKSMIIKLVDMALMTTTRTQKKMQQNAKVLTWDPC